MIDLLCGAKVTSKEPLKKVSIEHIYKAIKGESNSLAKNIKQLRFIKTINEKQYIAMKKELPFITTSWFNPRIRKKEHFTFSECLVLDIDHIADKQLSIQALHKQLKNDSRIMLLFTSPSNDGLKLFFRLNEKIYDSTKYSIFYKLFGADFSKQYGLNQVMDLSTSDVSRACFMSHDINAIYNPNAEPLDIYNWLPKTDFELMELYDSQPKLKAKSKIINNDKSATLPPEVDPDEQTLNQIKEWVGVKIAKNKEKKEANIILSEKLISLKPLIIEFLASKKLEVYENININYGLKLKIRLGAKEAEVNIFFGKRGFSVVESPKQGTHAELNKVVKQLLEVFFDELNE